MTARVTAKLLAEAVARLGDISTVPAQVVFVALLGMALRKEVWPGRAEMAKRGSMGEERLKTALEHLESYGLLSLPLDPADRRYRLPVLDVALIRAWLGGTHELTCVPRSTTVNTPQNAGHITPENAGYSKADSPENAGYPRARGNSSSSSTYARTFNPSAPTVPSDANEAHERHLAMLGAFRKSLVIVPHGLKDDVWELIDVYSVAEVQAACRKARRAGGRSFDYILSILANQRAEAALPDEENA